MELKCTIGIRQPSLFGRQSDNKCGSYVLVQQGQYGNVASPGTCDPTKTYGIALSDRHKTWKTLTNGDVVELLLP